MEERNSTPKQVPAKILLSLSSRERNVPFLLGWELLAMNTFLSFQIFLLTFIRSTHHAFIPIPSLVGGRRSLDHSSQSPSSPSSSSSLTVRRISFGSFSSSSGAVAKIPTSRQDRDTRAIQAIQAALSKPRTSSVPLFECEFPALQALNKLGDGSLRSAREAQEVRKERKEFKE